MTRSTLPDPRAPISVDAVHLRFAVLAAFALIVALLNLAKAFL